MMIRLDAFAKLNLSLVVHGKRPDGFHRIESLVQTIDLCDRVAVEVGGRGLRVENDLPGLEGPDLAQRAAEAILPLKAPCAGIRIAIRKGIPAGAGLGGGSSDAAAVLRSLDRLLEPRLPDGQLARLAEDLGSDVPLCLHGGLLRIGGRGEKVASAGPPRKERFLLLMPPVHCETNAVYAAFDGKGGHEDGHGPLGRNDLLSPALRRYPRLVMYHDAIQAVEAEFAGMSGSGSTFFAAFEDPARLRKAAAHLASAFPASRVIDCAPTAEGHRFIEGGRPEDRD
jgi:4-diphosphocytidyl-2-C-methyl-D-erythritol kinase